MPSDEITITILDDGTIKVETDSVSAPVHANAEAFLREMSRLAGGEVKVEKKQARGHVHAAQHAEH
jgi:hypothetical protein